MKGPCKAPSHFKEPISPWTTIQGPKDALSKGFLEPHSLFLRWNQEVADKGSRESQSGIMPSIAVLATVAKDGLAISQRPIQIVRFSDGEFFFLSVSSSKKIRQIRSNRRVSLLYNWAQFGRYITIEGTADIVPDQKLAAELFVSSFPAEIRASFVAVGDRQSLPTSNQDVADIASTAKELLASGDSQGEAIAAQPSDGMVLVKVTPDFYEFYQADSSGCVRLAFTRPGDALAAVDDLLTFAGANDWRLQQLCP